MLPSEEDEQILISKLDVIKDIRSKTLHLEKIKARINHELLLIKNEDQHLADYKSEMGSLTRERLMHIESLRLIERDISMIESTIAEAQQEKDKIQERTHNLIQEYNPLKRDIDIQRTHIGLERLTDIPYNEQFNQESSASQSGNKRFSPPDDGLPKLVPPNDLPTSFTNPSRHAPIDDQPKYQGERPRRQQQPPPMKTCSTCQELIHRNAPVCPLCKAKSTSRGAKKPKRRHESP